MRRNLISHSLSLVKAIWQRLRVGAPQPAPVKKSIVVTPELNSPKGEEASEKTAMRDLPDKLEKSSSLASAINTPPHKNSDTTYQTPASAITDVAGIPIFDGWPLACYLHFYQLNDLRKKSVLQQELVLSTYLNGVLHRYFSGQPLVERDVSVQSVSIDEPDSISDFERAQQKASEWVYEQGWSVNTLPLIEEVFLNFGWGPTYDALERAAANGMTAQELAGAASLKLWVEQFDLYTDYYASTSFSWSAALRVLRSFRGVPQKEELYYFVDELFDFWTHEFRLKGSSLPFLDYLWLRCNPANTYAPCDVPYEYQESWLAEIDHKNGHSLESALAQLQLNPRIEAS